MNKTWLKPKSNCYLFYILLEYSPWTVALIILAMLRYHWAYVMILQRQLNHLLKHWVYLLTSVLLGYLLINLLLYPLMFLLSRNANEKFYLEMLLFSVSLLFFFCWKILFFFFLMWIGLEWLCSFSAVLLGRSYFIYLFIFLLSYTWLLQFDASYPFSNASFMDSAFQFSWLTLLMS